MWIYKALRSTHTADSLILEYVGMYAVFDWHLLTLPSALLHPSEWHNDTLIILICAFSPVTNVMHSTVNQIRGLISRDKWKLFLLPFIYSQMLGFNTLFQRSLSLTMFSRSSLRSWSIPMPDGLCNKSNSEVPKLDISPQLHLNRIGEGLEEGSLLMIPVLLIVPL